MNGYIWFVILFVILAVVFGAMLVVSGNAGHRYCAFILYTFVVTLACGSICEWQKKNRINENNGCDYIEVTNYKVDTISTMVGSDTTDVKYKISFKNE